MTPRAKNFWTSFSSTALDWIYPPKCSLCEIFSPVDPCIQCQGEMHRSESVVTYFGHEDLDYLGSVYRYPGRAGQAVRQLKYHRRTGLARFMATSIKEAALEVGIDYDLAVPIPIHWFRLVSRGFNQADLLVSALNHHCYALRRVRATKPQAGLTTSERLKNLEDAFEVIANVKGKSILLVDDVVTSGQTARECAKALRTAGAVEVGILAFCGENYD